MKSGSQISLLDPTLQKVGIRRPFDPCFHGMDEASEALDVLVKLLLGVESVSYTHLTLPTNREV